MAWASTVSTTAPGQRQAAAMPTLPMPEPRSAMRLGLGAAGGAEPGHQDVVPGETVALGVLEDAEVPAQVVQGLSRLGPGTARGRVPGRVQPLKAASTVVTAFRAARFWRRSSSAFSGASRR